MTPNHQTVIDFLYTNIGRGHPHYIDGITESLRPDRVGSVDDVFSASEGVSRLAWSALQRLYHVAGRGGIVSLLYNRTREGTDYDRRRVMLNLLGCGLTRTFPDGTTPLVVAHPLLVAMLKRTHNLIYQHGEVVMPSECCVDGEHRILVPLSQTADSFLDAGFGSEQLFVSGLCIEPALVARAERALEGRSERLTGTVPLSGAFFSSGAEPRAQVELIAAAALSVHKTGGRSIVFAFRSGRLETRMRIMYERAGQEASIVASTRDVPEASTRSLLCLYDGRRDLNELTAALFSDFDYFVAPSHERTNWALGLGLPMFVVDPSIGSFAPLNREVLLDAGVALPIENLTAAMNLGDTLSALRRSAEFQKMLEAGWGRYDIRGFANIAAMLQSEY